MGIRSRRESAAAALRWVASCLCLWLVGAPAQERNFHHYSTVDGVPQRQVLAVARGPQGFMWLGTFGGASRFDGREFTTFTTREGLNSNTILDLVVDGGNRLVAATGRGLCYFEVETSRFDCPFRDGPLASGYVNQLLVDGDDILWAATERGLVRLDGRDVRQYASDHGLPVDQALSVATDPAGRIWVGTESGLVRLAEDGFGPVRLPGHQVTALLASEGGLRVATDRGLYRVVGGRAERYPGVPEAFVAAHFTAIERGADGTIWYGTQRGALEERGDRFQVVDERAGLLDGVIHTIVEDHEGNVWFGNQGGLSKLAPGPIASFDERHGLPHPFVRALAAAPDGTLWVGTRAGLAARDPHAAEWLVHPDENPAMPGQRIYSLAPIAGGQAWIGTDDGLYFYDGSRVNRRLDGARGLPNAYVPSLLLARDGTLWIGTAVGVRTFDGERLRRPKAEQLHQAFVLRMIEDGDGRIWFALRDGGVMVRQPDGGLVHLDAESGLTDQTVWDLGLDSDGRVWAASNGDGAFRIGADLSVEQFLRSPEGIHDDFIWNLMVDEDDRAWLYGNRGLLRFHPESGERRLYTDRDGLPDLEGSATAAAAAGGKLWFGSSRGLVRFDPKDEFSNTLAPKVVVTATRRGNGEPLARGEVLPHADQGVHLRFAANSFRDEQRVRYRYRLLGHDPDWSAATENETVSYGGLSAGRYEFQVIAANDDGVWSESPASFRFETARPWWGHPLAWGSGVVLLALTGWGGIRLSLWRIDRQRRQLKALVAQRTRELEDKNRQLKQLAITDELTGLFNRRHFLTRLRHEWELLLRSPNPTPLSLIILDLDYFKEVNDRFGHQVGDRVLAETAHRLLTTARKADTLARYGGEEFAMVLPFTDRQGALQAARRMLDILAQRPMEVDRQRTVDISASIGTVSAEISRDSVPYGIDELIRRADAALYKAKRGGRGRIVTAEEMA